MPSPTMQTQRVALITGGTGGLGSGVARRFAQAGWTVALTDLDRESLARHTDRLIQGEDPRQIIGRKVDVTDPAQAEALVQIILAQHGRIDALINTVGGYRAGSKVADLPDLSEWEAMWRINTMSAVVMCRAVLPAMRAAGWGRIVNIASRNALTGTAKAGAYGASKAAVINLTETIAAEEKAAGITANVLLPGTIDTPANRSAMPSAETSKWVTPEQLAATVLFLCTDEAGAINGSKIQAFGKG